MLKISLRNRFRAWRARRKGLDSFIATDGTPRLSRDVKDGELIAIPADHYEKALKDL